MITIKAPIELKIRSDLAMGYDAFGERIAGNYSLMGLEIGEEELLHMVTAPPEIYLMDGGSTTIGGNTFISSRNEDKYNIVNNMLNRILLSVDGELTYQDRTYITDSLHKLGIRDDRKFMTEVRRMIDESHLEEAFLNNYFEMVTGGENRELRERTLELTKELAKRETYHTERDSEDFLSERILHRLRTGAIYQIVSNFNKSLSDTRIELQETMLSEQENVARRLLVQNFLSNVIREEPELIRAEGQSGGSGELTEQLLREVTERIEGQPGERIRSEQTRITKQSESKLREEERLRIERETALFGEHETAELIYRESETETTEAAGTPGEPSERVIVERTRVEQPATTEYRTREELRTEQGTSVPAAEQGKEVSASSEGERTVSGTEPGEQILRQLTEESTLVTERRDREHTIERTEQFLTEREEALRTERERAELIHREGESREEFEETLLDRLTERTQEERERLTERLESEIRTKEQIGTLPGQEARTDRITSETLRETEREHMLPGAELPGSVTRRITEGGERVTERTTSEQRTDHTDRYVTEAGEILRTEHEGTELIYREDVPTEIEGAAAEAPGTLRETTTTERERIREAGEPVTAEVPVPGAPGEHLTEERLRQLEGERAEYHRLEQSLTDREREIRAEKERIEQLREGEKEIPVPGERISERLREESALLTEQERERVEAGERTEVRETYVTEAGEILRTEHEGAELIYREASSAEAEAEGAAEAPGTVRETTTTERERIREAGGSVTAEIPVPGEPGEQLTEERLRQLERERAEYHRQEQSLTDREREIRTGTEHISRLREEAKEVPVPGEQLRERLKEESTLLTATERERVEAGERTEYRETYVTEAGEVLRTEHEGAELIYREETAAEAEGVGETARETIRETLESKTERLTDRERLEREQSIRETREALSSMVRNELRERVETGKISPEELRGKEVKEPGTGHTEAELIYREAAAAEGAGLSEKEAAERLRETREIERERQLERERLEKERSTRETREAESAVVREELREELRTERLRTERALQGERPEAGRVYERTEMIHRREAAEGETGAGPATGRGSRTTERYRSDNVYEREILEQERSRTEVTKELTAAVLLDVVKTLFHAGYDRIGKGDTWIEYRGALYHSAENTFNRLNYNLEQRAETNITTYPEAMPETGPELMELSQLQEFTENTEEIETIEQTIREMNEMNLQNVERYQQMVEVLKSIKPERKGTGGMERTRQEALSLLDDQQELYDNLQRAEDTQEAERREVFQEITRIFPQQSMEIFRVVEQYLDGSGQPAGVGVTRNNVEAAAEEIRRITAARPAVQEPVPEPEEIESSELIYRRNDRVTQEELQEMVESLRRSENLQRREIEQRDQRTETDRRSTTTVTTNTERTLSRQEAEDIEALVNRGVRSQMSAISEQVLQKLEKKLKNEKIRRGI